MMDETISPATRGYFIGESSQLRVRRKMGWGWGWDADTWVDPPINAKASFDNDPK